jgi:PEGA domain
MRALITFAIVAAANAAYADGSIGVVVTGEATMQAPLAAQLEGWLRQHGHQLIASPLPPDAINTLVDCFVIEDQACARGVVEKRAKSDSLVFARVEVSPGDAGRDITLTAYWFVKGHNAIGERRVCERCSQETLKGTADTVMAALAGGASMAMGRLKLASDPPGMSVLLDNTPIGATPLERDLSSGDHTITLTHAGVKVGERKLTIHAGEVAEISMNAKPAEEPVPEHPPEGGGSWRTVGIGGVAVGAATALAGAAMIVWGGDDGSKPTYTDYRTPGIGVAIGGAVIAGAGAYLWLRGGRSDSAPVATFGSGGGYVGWVHRF